MNWWTALAELLAPLNAVVSVYLDTRTLFWTGSIMITGRRDSPHMRAQSFDELVQLMTKAAYWLVHNDKEKLQADVAKNINRLATFNNALEKHRKEE
jgi:hypothetical protein